MNAQDLANRLERATSILVAKQDFDKLHDNLTEQGYTFEQDFAAGTITYQKGHIKLVVSGVHPGWF